MLGILVNRRCRLACIKNLHPIMQKISIDQPLNVSVFTIEDIDLASQSVSATLLGQKQLVESKLSLPKVIANLSVQYQRKNIARLRSFSQLYGLSMLNHSNRLNQWSMLEMLASSPILGSHLLPFRFLARNDIYAELFHKSDLLFLGEKATSPKSAIYVREPWVYERIDPHAGRGIVEAQLFQLASKKKWLVVDASNLLTARERPVVVRVYLQKGFASIWTVLASRVFPAGANLSTRIIHQLPSLALKAVSWVNCFLPSLAISFVDFVIQDEIGRAYIIHIGGFDAKLIGRDSTSVNQRLLTNLLGYAGHRMTIRGGD